MKWKKVVLLVCLLPCCTLAQDRPSRLSIIAKGGASYYRDLYTGSAGGGTENYCGTGPILGAGVEYRATKVIRLQSTLEYAYHPFVHTFRPHQVLGNPRNTALDLSAHVRFVFGAFYLLAGPALSWQRTDDIIIEAPWLGAGATEGTPGNSQVALAFNVGAGLAVQITPSFGLFVEGSLRGRQYVSSALQGGFLIAL